MANKHRNQTFGFADRLIECMENKNTSISQLAKMIGVSRGTIYSWQYGDTMPNSLILAKICKILDASADYLLFGEDNSCMHGGVADET